MWRFGVVISRRRGLKTLGVLCITILLFVYLVQQNGNLDSSHSKRKNVENKLKFLSLTKEKENGTVHVLMSVLNLDQHPTIVRSFYVCLSSICKHASITFTLHIVTDDRSQRRADKVVEELKRDLCEDKVHVKYHDISIVALALEPFLDRFKDIFSGDARSYFSNTLFFLSIVSHTLFPNISKLIILDADLKLRADIVKLFNKFEDFSAKNLMGIAHELQPVYRHITFEYKRKNPETKIGAPFSKGGNPGFNSGVLLMNLARIRNSTLYKEYLTDPTRVRHLSEKYYFKGHLGDQGFYTLLSFDHPELFYVLPCTWNRQLCTWWRDNGYRGIFHLYHDCKGYVNVYHGNCRTPIPED